MSTQRAVVVHRGARDGYHVARALAERDLLEALVTDLYWPADLPWAGQLTKYLPARATHMLNRRWSDSATTSRVSTCWQSGLIAQAISTFKPAPFDWKRRATRWSDRRLGEYAGRLASERSAPLLSYSYYGFSSFSKYSGDGPRILFQLHPHPARVRQILAKERELHPDCAATLSKEWELALPEEEFERLSQETRMADYWIAASSFTRETLIESGVPGDRIQVVPYGTDLSRFRGKREPRRGSKPLQLLFVGSISQRKGIKYLLEALAMLPAGSVRLLVCGWAVDDLRLFARYRDQIEVRPGVSAAGLVEAYQSSDVFVFPSLAEGFGHVLLEAMASGLPIISTTRTAAADLVRPGIEGFLVPPGSTECLAASIEEFLLHPAKVDTMGRAARLRAEQFTWEAFRSRIGEVVGDLTARRNPEPAHLNV